MAALAGASAREQGALFYDEWLPQGGRKGADCYEANFLGACHEVTGSSTLIEIDGRYGLVDYGMEQGRNIFENAPLPVKPGDIDFLLLTHAHIDHSGYIPLLYKNGFRGQIFTTAVTSQLCQIMLRDSAHIQMQEAEWKSRKALRAGRPAVPPSTT